MKKKITDKQKEIAYKVISSILLCVALLFAALLLGGTGKTELTVSMVALYFGVAAIIMSLYEFVGFIYNVRKEGKAVFFRGLYYVFYVLTFVCAFGALISSSLLLVAMILFLAIPILKRIASVCRRHTKRNVVANALLGAINILVLVVSILVYIIFDAQAFFVSALTGTVLLFICLINIGLTVLSNFKAELLKKVVRKTYAGEILSGLLLLLVAFSLAIMSMEDGINSFGDALWYCFAVVTTIGFGDFAATTILGRILSVILGAYGIVVVSIITSIIVNFYNEVRAINDEDDIVDIEQNQEETVSEDSSEEAEQQ